MKKNLAKEAEKAAKQPKKKNRKKSRAPKVPKNTKDVKDVKVTKIYEKIKDEIPANLPVHTVIDPKPEPEPLKIEEIPLETEKKNTTEKFALGYKYTTEKVSQSWTWLRSRSTDQVLFGGRTAWGFSSSVFAFLIGIGLAAGWNAPRLSIIFLISVILFMGTETTRLIRWSIQKRSLQEAI
ncbi:MAG: hypothetical protein ACTSYI_17575 [Promethearchaeota archaeon]